MVASSSNMDVEETEDLTGVMWHDKNWLSFFPLTKEHVLEYFSLSQFYDERCNNQQIKLQRLDPKLLETMPGIEYQVTADPAPGLFIITKFLRSIRPPNLEPLAMYYVLEGDVYQAPSIHAILSSRILQSLHHLRKAFETMQNATAVSNQGNYSWEPPPVSLSEREDTSIAQTGAEVLSSAEKSAIDSMLFDVLEKNRQIHAAHAEKMSTQVEKREDEVVNAPTASASATATATGTSHNASTAS
ncbi:unnamed protein product [Agarophyton chilense]